MGRRGLRTAGLLAAVVLAAFLFQKGFGDDSPTTKTSPVPEQASEEISAQETEQISRVVALVDTGGPFPYDQDGATFENREGLLPDQPTGYYREYTVPTPGSEDRGARRLVIGEAGETYYTDDHYETFTRIEPEDFR